MDKTFYTRIKHRRDTAENWETNNPAILDGELIIVNKNDNKYDIKIGDGSTQYTSLPSIGDNILLDVDERLTTKADATMVAETYAEKSTSVKELHRYYLHRLYTNSDMPAKPTMFPPVGIDTFVWDGNSEGLESAMDGALYTYSDIAITEDNLANGGSVTYKIGESGDIHTTNMSYTIEDGAIMIMAEDEALPLMVSFPTDIVFDDGSSMSAGLYIYDHLNMIGDKLTFELTINGYDGFGDIWYETEPEYKEGKNLYTTLCTVYNDESFVYEDVSMSGAHAALRDVKNFAEEKSYNAAVYHDKCFDLIPGADTITWDGDTTGKIVVGFAGMQYVKLSDAVPASEDVSDWSAVFSDETNSSGPYIDMNGVKRFGTNDAMIVIVTEEAFNDAAYNEVFGETGTGVYFSLSDSMYPASFTLQGYEGFHYKKLKPEHLYQPDWSQNDDTQPDYIKNRTHWIDSPVTTSETTLEETTFDGFADGSYQVSGTLNLVEGAECIVTWDGVDYTSTCMKEVADATAYLIGNAALMNSENEDNGQPFCIIYIVEYGMYWFMSSDLEATSHTVKIVSNITTQEIHKLDDKYIDAAWLAKSPVYEAVLTVPETTVTTDTEPGLAGLYQSATPIDADITLINGKSIINVKIDGVDYTSNMLEIYFGNTTILMAGSYIGGDPYLGIIQTDGIILCFTTAGDHVVELTVENPTYNQLPSGYIKDSISDILPNLNIINASGTGSVRTVNANDTTAKNAFAEGYQTTATGDYSHAEGYQTTATGDYSHAEGYQTTALGGRSHAEGYSYRTLPSTITNSSTNDEIIAEWNTTKFMLAKYGHAEGDNTLAIGINSHAEGTHTIASGMYSHAEGCATIASGQESHAEGSNTISDGAWSHAEGSCTKATGDYSHTEGKSTAAIGYASHAEGYSDNKLPDTITSFSSNDAIITAWESTKFNLAKGDYSHTEGYNTLALGGRSHAEGQETIASNYNSHAEGCLTTASGNSAHAEGSSTTASGMCSHAEGSVTTASGADSHAEGQNTTACCHASHSEGYNTIASSDYQHVQGKYNIEDASNTYAHIVGNGNDASARSNAHTLDWDGNAWFAGNISIAGNSIVLADAVTGALYKIQIQNGQLVSFPVTE